MLRVDENIDLYRYEIHSLVKAFFPSEDVKVCVDGDANGDKTRKAQPLVFLRIELKPQQITLRFEENEKGQGTFSGQLRPEMIRSLTSEREADYTVKSKDTKSTLKSFLYQTLCEYTGRVLPWGDLIGIRPTKIAMTKMEAGASSEETVEFLRSEHYVSEEKAELAVDIAKREKRILQNIHYGNGYSLYIGIPFCPTTCLYCSFPSFNIAKWRDRIDDYLNALEREMEATAAIMKGKVLDTIYIGGGTPTSLEAWQLERLCSAVARYFDLDQVQEFTVEAGRPDSITRDKLEALRRHPITRISVNPQTMKEETLRIIGRRHSVQQVKDAFRMARECGFDNINMDLILGLPGENAADVAETVRQIKDLDPDSLTVHSLAIKRASGLRRVIDEKGYPVLINTDETMAIAGQGAADLGMRPYYLYRQKNMSGNFENVGYAREGRYGLYNILIMEEKQSILALGAGAVTKRVYPDGRIERCDNAKEITVYLENLEEMLERKRRLFAD